MDGEKDSEKIEKLQDNMERIKQAVKGEEEKSSEKKDDSEIPPPSLEEDDEKDREEDDKQEPEVGYGGYSSDEIKSDNDNEEEGIRIESEAEKPEDEYELQADQEQTDEDSGDDSEEEKPDEGYEEEYTEEPESDVSQEEEEIAEEGSLKSEIPEAPETKKLDIPDIEKGPLFIRVKKFKKAKKMVSEMHEMDDELKTQMAGLRSTLDEDRQITEKTQDFLHELRDSMKTIKEIVSPKKKE